jgi:hypothetical protein
MRIFARFVTFLGVIALVASAVMLPWTERSVHYQYLNEKMEGIPTYAWAGYHSVLKEPAPIIRYNDDGTIKLTAAYVIDRDRLLFEWLLVVLVTVGLVFVVTPREQRSLSITGAQPPPLSIR